MLGILILGIVQYPEVSRGLSYHLAWLVSSVQWPLGGLKYKMEEFPPGSMLE